MKEESPKVLLEIVRQLSCELHPDHPSVKLTLGSSLEKDAGIDSLGRIELLLRIEKQFGVTLGEDEAIGAETLQHLLDALGGAKPRKLGDLGSSSVQRKPVLRTVSSSADVSEIPENAKTLVEILDWHLEKHPDQTHIHLYPHGSEIAIPITYNYLYENALRVAGGLRARNVSPGDTVGIMLPTGEDYLFTFFGILLAGAVPVPLYPPQRAGQIEEHMKRQLSILKNAAVQILVILPEGLRFKGLLKSSLPLLKSVISFQELIAQEYPNPRVLTAPQNNAFIQYTSGSTGNPKGVVLTHANLLSNVRAMGRAVRATNRDVFVSWLPLYHDMGLIGAWFGSLYYGMQFVLMSPLSFMARPGRWLRAIEEYHGTLSAAPNFAYEICATRISDDEIKNLDLSSWRMAFNGAEPVYPDTLERFIQKFSSCGFRRESMSPVFGLAENSVGLAFPPPDRGPRIEEVNREIFMKQGIAEPCLSDEVNCLRFVSCGSVIPDHEVRIIDQNGEVVADRQVGKLQFRGPSATRHYFRNPEETAKLFHGNWLDTGDFAYIANGEIYITGREKEMIIRGGRNIYPYELEQAATKINGIRTGGVAIFGSQDPESRVEKLIVVAETREKRPEKREKIREKIIQESLELYQIAPDEIVLAEIRTILKTSSGKIRRAEMRKLYEAGKLGEKRSVVLQIFRLGVSSIPSLFTRLYRKLLEWFYSGYAWFILLLSLPISWVAIVFCPAIKWRHNLFRKVSRMILRLMGIPLEVKGIHNFPPERPLIIVTNHSSYLDGLILQAALPYSLRFVAKAELKKTFFAGTFLKRLNASFVERFDAKAGLGDARKVEDETEKELLNPFVFFPEGTFLPVEGILPFRMGAFVVAVHTGAKVLPVIIRGSRKVLRGDEKMFRRFPLEVQVLNPFEHQGEGWQAAVHLRDAVREEMLKHCNEPDAS